MPTTESTKFAPDPTTDIEPVTHAKRRRWLRRLAVAVVVVFVLLGAGNLLGVRTAKRTVTDGDVTLAVTYPVVTRGGLPSHWSATITRADEVPLGTVVVRTTAGFLDTFDHNDLVPAPDRVSQDERWLTWTFDDLDQSQLVITLDMRTQPDARWRRSTTTQVELADTRLRLDTSTWVLP